MYLLISEDCFTFFSESSSTDVSLLIIITAAVEIMIGCFLFVEMDFGPKYRPNSALSVSSYPVVPDKIAERNTPTWKDLPWWWKAIPLGSCK